MKNKQFREMLRSIDQARAIRRGTRMPARTFHFEPVAVRKIRLKLGLTQMAFAAMLCISIGTLRNWEQGRTYPEGPALALLRIAQSNPQALLKALHE